MSQKISPAAISRILSSAGFKKASTRTNHWSSGFEVTGYDTTVQIRYTAVNTEQANSKMDQIVETINNREDKKYFAKIDEGQYGSTVEVVIRNEENAPHAEAAPETVEVPDKVERAEVYRLLAPQHYAWTDSAAGFLVQSEGSRCVRVSYADHPYTSYALVIGGQEAYAKQAVENYATLLTAAGYSVRIDHTEEGGWSALVGPSGEFGHEDSPEDVKDALIALREAVEDEGLSYMTRKAGDQSLFIYYLVPFRDKVRRLEVSWGQGEYRSGGRFPNGGDTLRMKTVEQVVVLARNALAD